MKVAAAKALAALAREDVPDEVAGAYSGQRLQFGPDYLIPTPFDPRLVSAVPPAVAEAAMKSGVARTTIKDMDAIIAPTLSARLDPTVGSLHNIFEEVKANPKRVVFAEGEEEKTIRAATVFRNAGYGEPILIGRDEVVMRTMEGLGMRWQPMRWRFTTHDSPNATSITRIFCTSGCSATAGSIAIASAW